MKKETLRKKRLAAVRKVLRKPLSKDMRKYWLGVLFSLSAWTVEKKNMKHPEFQSKTRERR